MPWPRRSPGARPILFDGAVGTELIARGLDLEREAPESWLVDDARAAVVAALHAEYARAGADVLQTNTFGGTRPRLARRGLDASLAEINLRAAALARQAADAARAQRTRPGPIVVASLGPTGIDPFARDAGRAIAAAYAEQIPHLVAGGCQALHFETMYHPVEAIAAVETARQVAPALPVIVSATYAHGDQGLQTPLGVPLDVMQRAIESAAPDAVGVNCSLEARKMLGVLRRLRELTDLAILVQPQGAPVDPDCRAPRRDAATLVADFVRGCLALLDAGADMLGGCCGATPAHIAALAAALPAG